MVKSRAMQIGLVRVWPSYVRPSDGEANRCAVL